MRLSTDEHRDERSAAEVISSAIDGGITVFDTARAYGQGPGDFGHNERLLAEVIRGAGAQRRARVVTKGGMTRVGSAWIPDGRAKTIRRDCETSLTALGGVPIDLYLIHAPDPRTPWTTSLRALARIADEGLAARVGISNVNRRQLDEALELAPIAAAEVPLSLLDDDVLRGGVVERCTECGIWLIAHSPLGGPRRIRQLARRGPLAQIAAAHGVPPADVALAWLLSLSPTLIAIPGAGRAETVRSCVQAAGLHLDPSDHDLLAASFPSARHARSRSASLARQRDDRPQRQGGGRPARDGEIVLIMGIPGAGKSRIAAQFVALGYRRLNRDARGGGLRTLAGALDAELTAGARRIVLDNTYLTRASRSEVLEAAGRHRVAARCIWIDTPLAQAQVNLVQRLLERFGTLPAPDEVRRLSRREPGVMAPTSQMRARRELEPPAADEGFTRIDVVPFSPARRFTPGGPGGFIAAAAVGRQDWASVVREVGAGSPHLVFDWQPGGAEAALEQPAAQVAAEADGVVESALCPHPAGPPICWCRPPLPGLPLSFARAHGLSLARCTLIGVSPAHRRLAATLGTRFVAV